MEYNKVLVFGGSGMLGSTLKKLVNKNKFKFTDKIIDSEVDYCDITNFTDTANIVNGYNPDVIINLAALVDLEYCEENKDECYLTNTIAAINLFGLAKDLNIPYVFISTAGIFGNDNDFYIEDDKPKPLSTYGKSKYYVEDYLLNQSYDKYYIFRAGWMMGGGKVKDKKFVNKIMKQVIAGATELNVVDDKVGAPTYTKDFANSIIRHINEDLPFGLYNMVSSGNASRYDTAVAINEYMNLGLTINKVNSEFFKAEYFATRPDSEALINKKLIDLDRNYMRNWDDALYEYLNRYYKPYRKDNTKKNLIYFVAGLNPTYLELTKLCIESIKATSNTNNIDFIMICDEEYANLIDIPNLIVRTCDINDNVVKTSMRKINIFDYINVDDYNNILYMDGDIIVDYDINTILDKVLIEDVLYVVPEHKDPSWHNNLYFSLLNYTEDEYNHLVINNAEVFNCGQFLFKSTNNIKSDFDAVRQLILTHEGEYYFEQSFMNYHFNLKGNISYELRDIVLLFPEEYLLNKTLVHFCGIGTPLPERLAAMQSWYNISKTIRLSKPFSWLSKERLLNNVVSVDDVIKNNIDGDIVEIGVWKGGAILSFINRLKFLNENRRVHLYDTFEGMTEPTDKDYDYSGNKADISTDHIKCYSPLDEVKRNLSLVDYPNELLEYHIGDIMYNTEIPNKIAILRIDCDWYELTKHCLNTFYDSVVPNGIIIIDDYGYWKGCKEATDEFIHDKNITLIPIDNEGVWFRK